MSTGPRLEDTQSYMAFDTVVARFYEIDPQERVSADFAAVTHTGRVRDHNEDNYLVVRRRRIREILLTSVPREFLVQDEQSAYTMAVADGLGGRKFGELASFLALRTGWELGGGEVKWTMKVNEREVAEAKEKAILFFQMMHRSLNEAMQDEPLATGMGTTLTVCYTTGPNLFVLHAGDCRAYLVRGGQVKQLTRDHTVAQRLMDQGLAKPDSAEVSQTRRLLTSGLGGGFEEVQVDVEHHVLEDGDRLMICTDGLSDMVERDKLAALLVEKADPTECCEALLAAALEAGGKDNITVVVGRYRVQEPIETTLD